MTIAQLVEHGVLDHPDLHGRSCRAQAQAVRRSATTAPGRHPESRDDIPPISPPRIMFDHVAHVAGLVALIGQIDLEIQRLRA